MFLKLRVKAALAKFIVMNQCSSETLQFFEAGIIDSFLFMIEHHRFDPNQGAVMVITGAVARAALSGELQEIKRNRPSLYRDLNTLWDFCGTLVEEDEAKWFPAITVGELRRNPFDSPTVEPSVAASPSAYQDFDEWFRDFKIAAGKAHHLLAAQDGKCLVDFMDITPLRRAFHDGVNPSELGQEFGEQFDFAKFMSGQAGA